MISRMAQKLSKQMIDKNIVENEDEECYVYGLELLLSKMIVLSVR